MHDSYILQRGDAGARRLGLLARAAAPATDAFLDRIGLTRGTSALDVGCGIGGATGLIARRAGRVIGVDVDATYIELARARHVPGAEFLCRDLSDLETLEVRFDFVYARYLLSHLTDAAGGLRALVGVARPGAIVAVEDVDFPQHFHHPPCAAVERYIALYQATARSRGANPCVGRELVGLFHRAGLSDVRVFLSMTVHTRGPAKAVAEVTMQHIAPAVVAAGLATADEVDATVSEIREWRLDPETQISIAPTFQVWGRV